jgi:dTMP kinase
MSASRHNRPPFVVVEGLDGVGKSTLARGLAHALDAELLSTPPSSLGDVRAAADTAFARCPDAMELFYAATVAAASCDIRRILCGGRPVVLDRYLLSTLVYAELRARPLPLADLAGRLAVPDLTLLCVAPLPERRLRMERRGTEALPHDAMTLSEAGHAAGLRGYRNQAAHEVAGRLVELDLGALDADAALARATELVVGVRAEQLWRA